MSRAAAVGLLHGGLEKLAVMRYKKKTRGNVVYDSGWKMGGKGREVLEKGTGRSRNGGKQDEVFGGKFGMFSGGGSSDDRPHRMTNKDGMTKMMLLNVICDESSVASRGIGGGAYSGTSKRRDGGYIDIVASGAEVVGDDSKPRGRTTKAVNED